MTGIWFKQKRRLRKLVQEKYVLFMLGGWSCMWEELSMGAIARMNQYIHAGKLNPYKGLSPPFSKWWWQSLVRQTPPPLSKCPYLVNPDRTVLGRIRLGFGENVPVGANTAKTHVYTIYMYVYLPGIFLNLRFTK